MTATTPPPTVAAVVQKLKKELGDDPELVKQALADINALERQETRNHFEARIRYATDVMEAQRMRERGLFEYGIQTLKWAFLLNAGSIAIIVAFAGGMAAKTSTGAMTSFLPLMKSLWPFSVGCVLVTLAGAAGYFNFCYDAAMLPSAESLHNFMNPAAPTVWPAAKLQNPGETNEQFRSRIGWRLNATRNLAICLAFGSALCFAYGVYRVLRAVLAVSI